VLNLFNSVTNFRSIEEIYRRCVFLVGVDTCPFPRPRGTAVGRRQQVGGTDVVTRVTGIRASLSEVLDLRVVRVHVGRLECRGGGVDELREAVDEHLAAVRGHRLDYAPQRIVVAQHVDRRAPVL